MANFDQDGKRIDSPSDPWERKGQAVVTPEPIQPGDWVQVWGQVKNERTHPEDVLVEFFSHSEQWSGHVRKDRVVKAETPDFVYRCTAMTETHDKAAYIRCDRHDGHGGLHQSGGGLNMLDWAETSTKGYFEER